jgi:hypothetical protein
MPLIIGDSPGDAKAKFTTNWLQGDFLVGLHFARGGCCSPKTNTVPIIEIGI